MTSAKTIDDNPFLNSDYRRAAVGVFVDGIEEFPDRYLFAFKMDDFYVNIIQFFQEQGFIKYIYDFKDYWANSRNRNKIMGEFRFHIGKRIAHGHTFQSLPVKLAQTCLHVFHRMTSS